MKVKGIDISHNNGVIDWEKIDINKVQFAIIRAGYGTSTVDKQFIANIKGAIKRGIHIGIFWFGYAGTVEQAKAEGVFCLKTIAPYKEYIDYPVFYDWEYQSCEYVKARGVNPTKALVSNMTVAFMETIKSAGYMSGFYSNPNYLQTYYTDTVKNNYDLWLAHVRDNIGNPLEKSSYSGKYTIHQYSWVGKYAGITGRVDTDYCYKNYAEKSKQEYLLDYSAEQTSKVVTYDNAEQGNLFLSPHFQVKEFKSPDSNNVKIDNRLIWILERLFYDLQCSKMIINSGYRTPSYSVKVGGSSSDYHTKGMAADIRPYDRNGKIISSKTVCTALEKYGDVFGIGYISETAVHVDTRSKGVIWFGDETNGKSLIKSGYNSFAEYFGAKTLTVKENTWYVRDKPNVTGEIITVVTVGEKYKYTKTENDWAYIPELKGWLSGKGYKKES